MENEIFTTAVAEFVQQTQGNPGLIKFAESVEVTNGETEAEASDLFSRCSVVIKDIEAARKSKIAPFKEVIDAINANAKTIAAPYEAAKSAVSSKMSKYRSDVAIREQEAERNRLEAETRTQAFRGNIEYAKELNEEKKAIAAEVPKTITNDAARVQFREDWDIVIVDESAVPCEFCKHEPSLAKIKAALNAGIEVKGVTAQKVKKPVAVRV